MVCIRCGIEHGSHEEREKLFVASRAESLENDEIHSLLARGKDDGRRSSIAHNLRLTRVIMCWTSEVQHMITPTAWDVLLGDEAI